MNSFEENLNSYQSVESEFNIQISLKSMNKNCSTVQRIRTLPKEEIRTRLIAKIRKGQNKAKNIKSKYSKKSIAFCNEEFKHYVRERSAQTDGNDFSCPICLEMMISPSPTPCGHIFCFKCLQQALIHKPVCPSCRAHIRSNEFPISQNYEKINSYFWKSSVESKNYHQRVIENNEWKTKRFINPVELAINQKIDVRDTEHVWCKATVRQIFSENNVINEVLVHYHSWNKIYDEVINVKSQRLAPDSFFSSRNDIPKYKLSQDDDNFRGRIAYGSQRQQSTNLQILLNEYSLQLYESVSDPLFPNIPNLLRSRIQRNRVQSLRFGEFVEFELQEENEQNSNQQESENSNPVSILPIDSRNQGQNAQNESLNNPESQFSQVQSYSFHGSEEAENQEDLRERQSEERNEENQNGQEISNMENDEQ